MAGRPVLTRLLPRVYQIVEEINRRFLIQVQEKYPNQYEKIRNMAILYDGQVQYGEYGNHCRFLCQWCSQTAYTDPGRTENCMISMR